MSNSMSFFQELTAIETVLEGYRDGLYTANTELLATLFHPTANLQAPNLRLTRDEWLTRVQKRPKPDAEQAQGFDISSIEIIGQQAVVKLSCTLFGFQYTDVLSLLKENDRWLIVNKMYCDSSALQVNNPE